MSETEFKILHLAITLDKPFTFQTLIDCYGQGIYIPAWHAIEYLVSGEALRRFSREWLNHYEITIDGREAYHENVGRYPSPVFEKPVQKGLL